MGKISFLHMTCCQWIVKGINFEFLIFSHGTIDSTLVKGMVCKTKYGRSLSGSNFITDVF